MFEMTILLFDIEDYCSTMIDIFHTMFNLIHIIALEIQYKNVRLSSFYLY